MRGQETQTMKHITEHKYFQGRKQGDLLTQADIQILINTPVDYLREHNLCFNCGIKYDVEHRGCCDKQCLSEYYANTVE